MQLGVYGNGLRLKLCGEFLRLEDAPFGYGVSGVDYHFCWRRAFSDSFLYIVVMRGCMAGISSLAVFHST